MQIYIISRCIIKSIYLNKAKKIDNLRQMEMEYLYYSLTPEVVLCSMDNGDWRAACQYSNKAHIYQGHCDFNEDLLLLLCYLINKG